MRVRVQALARAASLWIMVGLLYGCSGGGCGGMEPIPEGFPLDRRVQNGVQMRLTSSGVEFIEDNIEPILGSLVEGGLAFPVPPMTQDITVGTAEICHSGECYFCMEIAGVELTPTPPNRLRVRLDVIAWTGDASCGRRGLDLVIPTFLGDIDCAATVDTRDSGSASMPVAGTVEFTIDPTSDYTGIEFNELDATSGFEDGDISLDGGFLCTLGDWMLPLFMGSLIGGLNDQLAGAMGEFTCAACDGGEPCPAGSTCDGSTCIRPDGTCASPLLGMEGRLDMGALLASTSPGTQAEVDMLLAAGHYADAHDDGLSLGMYGGMEPATTSHCVPHVDPPPLGPVPISEVIHNANDCATCSPPDAHMIVGVSETYLNRAGWGFHQSGGLCLGVGGATLPVTTGALAMLMPSIRGVTWGAEAPLAIDLRPANPPVFELGANTEDDPLLAVSMDDVAIDFYVWGHDRYTRLMTAAMDLTVNLDLRAEAGEIQVAVDSLETENLTIENSELLSEDPVALAAAFAALIDTMLGPMLGDLGAFALPPMAGFQLNIPDGGLGHLEDGGEEFLMLNATLAISEEPEPPPPPMPLIRTEAEITELQVPPTEAFSAYTSPPQIPRVMLALDAEGAELEELEFRTRVDSGCWTPWSAERDRAVEHGMFLFQGRHRIEVQARIAGRPETADPAPVELEVIIDTLAPELTLTPVGDDRLEVEARDMVSAAEAIRLEWRASGEDAWLPVEDGVIDVPPEADEVEVRGTDEAGNVGVRRHAIRGRLPTDGGSGCGGCATAERGGDQASVILLLGLLAGALIWRRRRWFGPFVLVLLASASLIACGGPGGNGDGGACDGPDAPEGCCESDDDCGSNARCCPTTNLCVEYTDEDNTCDDGQECNELPELDDECNFLPCSDCETPTLRELLVGMIGLHSSVAVAPDGSAWVAGYAAGTAYNRTYGDLVVAQVVSGMARVSEDAWVVLDGVPAGAEVTHDPAGWRGGISEPGDDVGLYASIAGDGAGSFGVAYYDATNTRLKYIASSGGSWGTPVVVDGDAGGHDAGRYADLIFLPSGVPAIAYMVIEDLGDRLVTRARYVEATDASGASWGTPVDLDVMDPTPAPEEGATPDLPEGTGIWPDLAVGPGATRGVIFYNRTNGNLMGAAFDGSAWGPAQILAGRGGDQGWAPSLAIDEAGVWHSSFVDGIAEDLVYLNSNGVREVIDGRSLGEHWSLRGDDSHIVVLPSGEIRVAYQDATTHQLWLASRDPSGFWTTEELAGAGLGETAAEGFYVSHAQNGGSGSVVSAWFYDASGRDNGVLLFWR